MYRSRSALLLMWNIAILAPLTGTSRPLAADQLSAIGAAEVEDSYVKGKAIFVDADGVAHTCRFGDAILIPVKAHSVGLMLSFFGSTTEGRVSERMYRGLIDRLGPDAIHADCDADGNFAFTQPIAGSYFVIIHVLWFQRWAHDGAVLMRSVEIANPADGRLQLEFTAAH